MATDPAEPRRIHSQDTLSVSMRGEASLKLDAVIISTAAATELGLRDVDNRALFRLKEGDESAVPESLRGQPFQLVRIFAAMLHAERESAKANARAFWIAILAGVIVTFLGAIFTAFLTFKV
jgi:hypothetical protein